MRFTKYKVELVKENAVNYGGKDFNINNAKKMASNRGNGWSISTYESETATQLLLLLELGEFNAQRIVGKGVVNITADTLWR